ncbi:hypothetical protein AVEN_156553-1 [Araneus ventricosus]|uniref:Uncharacterized protein n=1 Tax=Araneus ventricosus TaxID=182803 RepID=A0A4Y2STR1_ARAVE|nr:hypothetical protein AVEN_61668-1 [Araneus ventricosus]GBN90930.1 hypothetical protein AVEN_156553-1 [Araneus ventricosus]
MRDRLPTGHRERTTAGPWIRDRRMTAWNPTGPLTSAPSDIIDKFCGVDLCQNVKIQGAKESQGISGESEIIIRFLLASMKEQLQIAKKVQCIVKVLIGIPIKP